MKKEETNNQSVFKAPQMLPTKNSGGKYIFLAGTIEQGNSVDWQTEVTDKLLPNWTVFNPRRESWDASWEQTINNPQFKEQVDWEMDALDLADVILLNLLPDSKSPISLLELGLYANSSKMIVVCPDGFWRKGNVEVVCKRFNIQLFESLNIATSSIITGGLE